MLLNVDKPFRRAMLHNEGCVHVPIPTGTEFKPLGRIGRDGGWFAVSN